MVRYAASIISLVTFASGGGGGYARLRPQSTVLYCLAPGPSSKVSSCCCSDFVRCFVTVLIVL